MRLEVICEDRLGLTRELLAILAAKQIDLRGIEIDPVGIIYLNCPDIDFDAFSALMAEIRRISGVKDVRKIPFMPMERHNNELTALLNNLSDAILTLNSKGAVDMANQSALSLFNRPENELIGSPISSLLPSFHFNQWLDSGRRRLRETMTVQGLDHQLELMPVYIRTESGEPILASAMMILRHLSTPNVHQASLSSHNPLGFEHFVGVSARHKNLMVQAKKLAMLDEPLLVEGETGTGKEILARACHNRSNRAAYPFLVLSCASMPDDVAETELFGHAPGAFNYQQGHKGIFEQAHGGTVFLDEIGEMSPHLQIKLLRLLQDGTFRRVGEEHEIKVNVRVIASTRYQLAELTQAGKFREDLFYRLNVLTLRIAPLRERPSDIRPLLALFVAKHSQKLGMTPPILSDHLVNQLEAYSWPGNLRQLDNTVLRALTEMSDEHLTFEHFHLPKPEATVSRLNQQILDTSLDEIMKTYEAQVLEQLYQSFPSSRKLAKRLNVSHTSIANKLREYQIGRQ